MSPNAIQGFIEIRNGGRRIYIKKDYAFLSEYLKKDIYPWSKTQHKESETTVYEGRGQIYTLALGPQRKDRAVIKHYRRGGLFRFVLRDLYCGSKRFFKELEVAERAKALGIPTAEVLALVMEKKCLFLFRADLVTMEIPGSMNLAEYLNALSQEKGQPNLVIPRWQILSQIASLLKRMHRAGIYHADLNLRNILVTKAGESIEAFVIDLDRARYRPQMGNFQRLNNLVRLYRSLEKMGYITNPITIRDLYKFVEFYCQDEPGLEERCKRLLRRSPMSLRVHRLFWRITKRHARALPVE